MERKKTPLFWFHSQACDQPLSKLVIIPIPPKVEGALGKELWDANEGWKWHLFEELLPVEILKRIVAISPNTNGLKENCLVWDPIGTDTCSIKSILFLIR